MGGIGSGRREYATTPTVGQCRTLDADQLTEYVDASGFIDWQWDEDTTIRMYLEKDGAADYVDALRFVYTTRPNTDDATEYEYRVQIEYTEPNFGGVRPWFLCPECRERRRKLYLPPRAELFACRECYDLGYQSSRSSGNDLERAEQRYRKAFAKADAESRQPHPNNMPFTPERPKGMHHDTFEDLCDEVKAARDEWHEQMRQREQELLERLQRSAE